MLHNLLVIFLTQYLLECFGNVEVADFGLLLSYWIPMSEKKVFCDRQIQFRYHVPVNRAQALVPKKSSRSASEFVVIKNVYEGLEELCRLSRNFFLVHGRQITKPLR